VRGIKATPWDGFYLLLLSVCAPAQIDAVLLTDERKDNGKGKQYNDANRAVHGN
jgi:hypothetical protein